VVQGWMYGTILPRLSTLRAMAAAAHFDGTLVGLGWLVYGADYPNHAVTDDEFQQYYRGENKLLRR
jgi:hypothetical protein